MVIIELSDYVSECFIKNMKIDTSLLFEYSTEKTNLICWFSHQKRHCVDESKKFSN